MKEWARLIGWPSNILAPGPDFWFKNMATQELELLETRLGNLTLTIEKWTAGLLFNFYSHECLNLILLIDERRYPINGARYGQIPLVIADNGNVLRRICDAPSFVKGAKNRHNVIQQSHAPQSPHVGPSSEGPYHQAVVQMSHPPAPPQMAFSSQGSRQVQTTYQYPSRLLGTVEESVDQPMNSALYQMEDHDMSSSFGDDQREVSHGPTGLYGSLGSSVNPTNVAFTGVGSAQWVPMEGMTMTATRRPPFHHPVSPFISLPSLSLLDT
jgi:hypothetical protein